MISFEPTTFHAAAFDPIWFVVIVPVIAVGLIYAWVNAGRCPQCNRTSVFHTTGAERSGQGRLALKTEEEWLCEQCGHREWKKKEIEY